MNHDMSFRNDYMKRINSRKYFKLLNELEYNKIIDKETNKKYKDLLLSDNEDTVLLYRKLIVELHEQKIYKSAIARYIKKLIY